MKWKAEYRVGIQEIDDQHRVLLEGFSAVEKLITDGVSWSTVHYALIGLRQNAHRHFDFEEALMRLYGFPRLAAHQQAHRDFFLRLDEIELHALHDTAKKEMVSFLYEWLEGHTAGADRDYANFILAGAQILKSRAADADPSSDFWDI